MSDARAEQSGEIAAARLIDRRGRCRLTYEPIADLARGTVCGYEALARFPDAIEPEAWRVVATRRGLEPDLEAFVIGSVLAARDSLPRNCFLSFNILPHTLLRKPVRRVIERAGRLDGLVVELCPRSERPDAEQLANAAAAVRQAGAKIAVDDVGGEGGVLGFAGAVQPKFVKLDPRLVRGLHRDDKRRMLIEGVAEIASRFDAWVIAQGVEQIEELDALMSLRIPLAQGPLVGVGAKTLTRVAFVLSSYVRERGAELRVAGELAALVERTPAAEHGGDPMALAAAFRADAELRFVPLVDERERPVGIAERGVLEGGGPSVHEALVVSLAARLPDVARRAMTRPQATRFQPLACVDASGAYLGLVRVERLVMALATVAAARVDDRPG